MLYFIVDELKIVNCKLKIVNDEGPLPCYFVTPLLLHLDTFIH
jgi:hypothetical protein